MVYHEEHEVDTLINNDVTVQKYHFLVFKENSKYEGDTL